MKLLKKILIVLVIVIGLVLIISAFMPKKVVISRSRVISAPKEVVFEKINTLQKWPKWMAWAKLDSAAVYTYSSDPAVGKGAWYTWKGNKEMGEGKMIITEVYGTDSMNMDLIFADYPPNPVQFKLFDKDKGTEIVWSMTMEFQWWNAIMGMFMDGMMGPDFEGGLEGIEKLALNEPVAKTSAYNFTVEESKPMMCLLMKDSCVVTSEAMAQKMGKMYGDIQAEMKAQKVDFAGAPFSVNIRFDEGTNFLVFSPGIPVTAEIKNLKNKNISYAKFDAQKVLVYDYYGDYTKMSDSYIAMYKHIADNKMEVAGNSREEYITDPMKEPDTAKWNTKIYIPVK